MKKGLSSMMEKRTLFTRFYVSKFPVTVFQPNVKILVVSELSWQLLISTGAPAPSATSAAPP